MKIFLPLACGGAIILVDNLFALATAPAKDGVRLINTVPSLMSTFLTESSLPGGIRVINLIGEALPRALADRLLAERSDLRLFNLYGPTETTVYSTASVVNAKDRRSPPIGGPIWNTEAYVLDDFLQLVPDGAVGELWIGGAGVAKGYLNRAELTDQRFVPNPFGEGRIYKTGDLVRWLSSGELEFCGRVDQQVKINGVRIELGEIEQCLRTHPAVGEAVVTAVEDERSRKGLVAHLVSKRAGDRPSDTAIRNHLAKFLPSHSMPASLAWLNELPLTSNGKVDRNALSAPQVRSSLARARVPDSVDNRALDKIETSLLDIWRRHFKGQNIGVNQNYFELGGDSLDAFWLIGRCNKTFKTSLPLSLLFTHPTIERLADAIRSALAHEPGCQEWQNTYGNSPLVVFFPGIGGDNQISADFRSLFDGKLRFLVIAYPRWREMIKGKALLDAMIASSTVQIRRAYRPENCLLVGYSFGGMIAHEGQPAYSSRTPCGLPRTD